MIRRLLLAAICCAAFVPASLVSAPAARGEERAYGRVWGGTFSNRDYDRFWHYPYVYYPQNFYGNEYYRSSDNLYDRYPPEMRIPVYNRQWFNYYPEQRKYYYGHHFILDVF